MEFNSTYLTLDEGAAFLRVTPPTLARWAARKKVPAYKTPGGQWRFHEADLILALRPASDGPSDDKAEEL